MEYESLEETQSLTDEFPLVKKDLIAFELIPLGPFEPLEAVLNFE